MRAGCWRLPPSTTGCMALLILVLTCAVVQARSTAAYDRDGWTIEAVDKDGRLAGCGASTVSAGWRLGIAHSADGTWEIIFSRLGRPFEVGEEYDVTLLADGRPIFRGVGEVLPNGIAHLSPELSEQAVTTLRRSSRLEYATRRGSKMLGVRGIASAIDALRQCVRRRGQQNSRAKPPRILD